MIDWQNEWGLVRSQPWSSWNSTSVLFPFPSLTFPKQCTACESALLSGCECDPIVLGVPFILTSSPLTVSEGQCICPYGWWLNITLRKSNLSSPLAGLLSRVVTGSLCNKNRLESKHLKGENLWDLIFYPQILRQYGACVCLCEWRITDIHVSKKILGNRSRFL